MMSTAPTLFGLLATLLSLGYATNPHSRIESSPDWENEQVFSRNRQPAHATFTPFPDIDSALQGPQEASPYRMSLNGTWRFYW